MPKSNSRKPSQNCRPSAAFSTATISPAEHPIHPRYLSLAAKCTSATVVVSKYGYNLDVLTELGAVAQCSYERLCVTILLSRHTIVGEPDWSLSQLFRSRGLDRDLEFPATSAGSDGNRAVEQRLSNATQLLRHHGDRGQILETLYAIDRLALDCRGHFDKLLQKTLELRRVRTKT
jgi:hypothetical protein